MCLNRNKMSEKNFRYVSFMKLALAGRFWQNDNIAIEDCGRLNREREQ